MKARLNSLENALNGVEDVLEGDVRLAHILRAAWRAEYQQSGEEMEHILSLAREIHARPDDPEVLAEIAPFIVAESEYVDARAREHVDSLTLGERPRWKRLLGVSEGH